MEQRPSEASAVCLECGRRFLPRPSHGYLFGEDGALCAPCAIRRGGRYDARFGRWTMPPATQDLPSCRRSLRYAHVLA